MNAPVPRSLFVTVLAWTTIIPAAFGVLIGGVQTLLFNLFMSPADLERMLGLLGPGTQLTQITFGNLRLWLLLFLASSIIFLVTGIGLLRRRNWARVLFVAMIALATLYGIVTAVFVDSAGDLFQLMIPETSIDGAAADFSGIAAIARATTLTLTAVFTVFNLWLIWKLMTQPIVQEFLRDS